MTAQDASYDTRFQEWLSTGIAAGFCGPIVCATHDSIPTTAGEDELIWDHGEDICIPCIRPYASILERKEVEANHGPTQWRSFTE